MELGFKVRPPCVEIDARFQLRRLSVEVAGGPGRAVWFFAREDPLPQIGAYQPSMAQLTLYSGEVRAENEEFEAFSGIGQTEAYRRYEWRDEPPESDMPDFESLIYVVHSRGRTVTFWVATPHGRLPLEERIRALLRSASGQ